MCAHHDGARDLDYVRAQWCTMHARILLGMRDVRGLMRTIGAWSGEVCADMARAAGVWATLCARGLEVVRAYWRRRGLEGGALRCRAL